MTTGNASTRPNFFILLDLNPNATWDQTVFESALKAKRNDWSRQGSWVGQKALTAKQNLALIPEINRVMADETLREAEAEAARAVLASKQKGRFDEFERRVVFFNRARAIEEADLDKLINDFQDILSPDQIKARINVPINKTVVNDETLILLDPTVAKKIADDLQILGMKTLYELLNLPVVTATPVLYRAAEDLYKDVVRRMPKTAEVTAKTELAGLAIEMFKTEDMRRQYDESLRQATIEGLLRKADELVSGTVKRVMELEQVTLFLDSAQQAGWDREEARSKLEEFSLQHRWIARVPDTITPKLKCGKCGELNDKSNKKCTNCAYDLYIECPKCGESTASDQRRCGNCGFEIGNQVMVDAQLEQLQTMIKVGDLKGNALDTGRFNDILSQVQEAWQTGKADERSQKIEELKRRAKNIEASRQHLQQMVTDELKKLVAQKRFYTAREHLLKRGEHIATQERDDYKRVIEEKIAEAQSLLRQARLQNDSQDIKIDMCRQAIQVCADYKDAQDLLRTMPPSPPSNLQARTSAAVVSLSWNASPTRGVDYTVVRKVHARPNSPKDGKVVGTVSGLTYDDATPIIGRPLYYAVFAGFDTIFSNQAAMLSEPVLLTQDVSAVTARVDNQQVDLAWETPPNVHSVVVVRSLQSPSTSIRDGQRIADHDPQQKRLVDRDVQNGKLYYYGIYCQFMNHEGRLVQSIGKVVSATPEEPPVPIHHLTMQSVKKDEQHFEIDITWNHPNKGSVVILKSVAAFPEQVSKILPEAELSNYGQILQDKATSVKDVWTETGVAYFTPVVIFQKTAYVGTSQRFACVDNISNLKYQNIGNAIRFHWRWPENCQEVLVAYSTFDWPRSVEDRSPNVSVTRVNRAQYDHIGHFDLQGVSNQEYYILISAVIDDVGTKIVAESIRIQVTQATKLEVTYEIKTTGIIGNRKRKLCIKARTAGTLPKVQLIARQGRLPFSKRDGDLLQSVGPIIFTNVKKEEEILLAERDFPRGTLAKLFLEDDTRHNTVIIHQPGEEKLRLS
jgi:hypothetical protein